MSDNDLAAKALGSDADDREALGELLDRHLNALLGFFVAQVRNRALAEDLVQEVCLRVVRSRRNFGPPYRFRPWLWRIAHNVARRARGAQARGARTFSLEGSDAADRPLPEELFVDDSPSPRHRAASHQRSESLWRALRGLEEGQRDVVILKGIQELPCHEVAQILEISEGTVWSRFHRALARLRELLSPKADEL